MKKQKKAKELKVAIAEKAKKTAELVIANKKLIFENSEKQKRAAELAIANKEKDKDIIYLKKIKEKLQYYKNLIVTNSTDAIIIQNFDGVITAWNKAAEKIYGFTEKEMLGQNITKIIKKEYRTEAEKNINAIRQGRPTFKSSQIRITKDKKEVFINIIYSPIYETGEVIEVATTGEDMTKKKKLEEELERQQRQDEAILNNTQAGILKVAVDNTILYSNPAFSKILGYSGQELRKMTFKDFTYPEDLSKSVDLVNKLTSGKIDSFNIEKRYIRKDKKVIYGNTKLTSVKDSSGKVLYSVVSLDDITEIKEANEQLEEKISLLSSTIESTADGILVISLDRKIKISNNSFREMWNVPPNLIHNKDDKKLLNFAIKQLLDPKEFLNKVKYLYHHQKERSTDNILLKDGRILERHSRPQFLNKKIVGRVWNFKDITVERKAKESSEKLAFIVENTIEGHAIFNAGKKPTLVYVNEAWENITGYKREEVINKEEPFMFKAVKDNPEQKDRILSAIKLKKVIQEEMEWTVKDGRKIFVNVLSMPITSDDNCNKWFNTIRDITSRKELDDAKAGFLSLASHQLRTPLSMTKWLLESLLYYDNNLTENQLGKVNDLIYSNERLIKLVNNLLNVSTIDTGKLSVEKQVNNITRLIFDLSNNFKKLALEKNKIIKIFAPLKPVNIYCDRLLVHEALENLLTNAINYSDENSEIIKITVKNNKNYCLISINNGGVIDPISIKKIKSFEKFSRGVDSAEKQPTGSGLGLYVTKKVIEANGGRLWFESNIKTGTTFNIEIFKGNYMK